MDQGVASTESPEAPAQTSLSYKFQRLREKLREAIASGELEGKLPGERALAKRFHVNAKTLSKALTDLAAEGLLDRSIGRGTFVKGSAPVVANAKRWLVVCNASQTGWDIIRMLQEAHAELDVLTDLTSVRPSLLNQYGAVIVLSKTVPDTFIRDLVVRNISVVVVGMEPKTYSTHAVVFDRLLAVSLAGRELMLSGHRRFAAVEPPQCTVVADTLRKCAGRYAPDAHVDACFPQDAAALASGGITGFVCYSVEIASEVKEQLVKGDIAIPGQVSIVAVGSALDHQPVSGYFMHRAEKVNAIIQLLEQPSTRPTTIWLAGRFADHGTISPVHNGHQVHGSAEFMGTAM